MLTSYASIFLHELQYFIGELTNDVKRLESNILRPIS